jgi:3-phosphoshikimate 1-carboxyvinyltransferase
MGILAGRPGSYVLDGDEQLRRRPMERVADPLRRMGAEVKTVNGKPPVTIKGGELKSIDYTCVAASAQLKSAVLLATLSAKGPSAVTEPCLTRDHTERLINFWGGSISHSGLKISLSPGILKMTNTFECPGDPSSAAFFLSAAAFNEGSSVTAENILMSQLRTGFLRVLDRMGAKVSLSLSSDTPEPAGGVKIEYDGPLMATEITSEETPSLIDEIPILALAATQAVGRTIFRQVDELRIKETDRLASISSQLTAMGAKIVVEGDDLIVDGPTVLKAPNQLDSSGDHRLAMTLAIALKTAKAETKILGDKSIPISYPEFNSHLAQLWRD